MSKKITKRKLKSLIKSPTPLT